MSRPSRRQRQSALLRGRLRTLFFAGLLALCVVLQAPAAAGFAAAGAALGALSIVVALRRGDDHALTFAAADWLVLAAAAIAGGGADSLLLLGLPLLTVAQLAPSGRSEWPYLLSGSLLLVIVLAIDDGSLGGGRAAGLAKLFVLVAGGVIAALELQRPRRRRQRVVTVDPVTGFYSAERLRPMLSAGMRAALVDHQPLSVVRLRLEHFADSQAFLGPQAGQELVSGVARRIARKLGPDDLAFRTAPDTFVLCLPGTGLNGARELAGAVAHEIGATLIAGRRQTLESGVASFPTVRSLDELLAEAQGRGHEFVVEAPPLARPAAAAQ